MVKIVIPFKPQSPKSRLSDILTLQERSRLVELMLLDVVETAKLCSDDVMILASEMGGFNCDCVIKEDPRDLNTALNSVIKESIVGQGGAGVGAAVVMSDLPLLTPETLKEFLDCEGDIVIAPGRRGGTNLLLIRDGRFRVSYHYGSFHKHLQTAGGLGIGARVFDSFYASTDIDDKDDLLELMLHGKGRAKDFLLSIGFTVDTSSPEPVLRR
ncbi:MAG: 2-phospho-L-lactate guanylyltransferase [Archaeoglobaceae archaeon]